MDKSNLKVSDLQIAAVTTTGSATKTFAMTHSMGLANIKMAAATAAASKETLTLDGNTTTTKYSSGTTNGAFYALDEFVTNLPFKQGTRNTASLACYFIVNPAKSYTFSTSYKYADADANRQWNNLTVSSSSNAVTSGKYKEITTSVPKFKNLGRLYSYTGSCQTYTPIYNCQHQMECWGARGGYQTYQGYGGYTSGNAQLSVGTNYYACVGQAGSSSGTSATWNGGGPCGGDRDTDASGGGATDIRLVLANATNLTVWKGDQSLRSRIMVAAGGGGEDDNTTSASFAGGLQGYYGNQGSSNANVPDQFKGGLITGYNDYSGSFGYSNTTATTDISGGGGGYWGGGGGDRGTHGGSSYISGHAGCVAVTSASSTSPKGGSSASPLTVDRATHYSGLAFDPTVMIDGAGYQWTTSKGSLKAMPNPTTASSNYSSGVGHSGNGYARITCKPYD